jgi:hypothetical protein
MDGLASLAAAADLLGEYDDSAGGAALLSPSKKVGISAAYFLNYIIINI